MSKTPKNMRTQTDNFLRFPNFFVGQELPSIGMLSPAIRPLVGRKIPFTLIQRNSGMTLIELMVTLVVAGILFSLAIPSMRTIIQNTRIANQTNEMITDLNFARSEAIKRASNVTICNSNNPTAAVPECDTAGTSWGAGRIIFIDSDPDGQRVAAEELLRVRESLEGSNTLMNAAYRIVYTRTGAPTAGAVSFGLCDTRGETYGRKITIEATGRTGHTKPADTGSC